MPHRTTAVLRLERRIHDEHQRAFQSLQDAHAVLSELVLTAARAGGWTGDDPCAAARFLGQPRLPEEAGRALGDLWLVFFECFRADEGQAGMETFRERATAMNHRLGAAVRGGLPIVDAVELIETLGLFWRERQEQIDRRIDALLHEAHGARGPEREELDRLVRLVDGVLPEAQTGIASPAQRLAKLLVSYRDELLRRRTASDDVRRGLEQAHEHVRALVGGPAPSGPAPASSSMASEIVAMAQQLDDARRRLEQGLRDATRKLADLEADRRQLLDEIAHRDERLSAGHEAPNEDVVQLYREAVASLRSGGDASAVLARIHAREHRIDISREQADAVRIACERELDALLAVLVDWHALGLIAADPKRLRPRLLSGADRRLLSGVLRNAAQAVSDAVAGLEQQRRIGVAQAFVKQVPALSAIFRELVELIADHRKRQGGPSPVSVTIELNVAHGVLALPAVLASDLRVALSRRGATAFSQDMAPLLVEVATRLRNAVSGLPGIPAPTVAPPKETAKAACLRLADDVALVAAHAAAQLGGDTDRRLAVPDRHLREATEQRLAALCREVARLPGAPPLPALTEHVRVAQWLHDVAQHHLVIG